MRHSVRHMQKIMALVAFAATLSGCSDFINNEKATDREQRKSPSFRLPASIENMVQSRMIDRDVLFAEIILRYSGAEEVLTATRQENSDIWAADFRLPSGRDFSLEVTWYDTADGQRLNLVRFERDYQALFSSGPVSLDFLNYDFDDYDADSDDRTNLLERREGTSPLQADTDNTGNVECPVIADAVANASNTNLSTGEAGKLYAHVVRNTDTFDLPLPQINVYLNNLASNTDGLTAQPDGTLKVSVTSNGEYSSIYMRPIVQDSDFLRARLTFVNAESSQPLVDENTRGLDSRAVLSGVFFNSIADQGNGDSEGNARLGLNMRNFDDGGWSRVLLCAQTLLSDERWVDFVEETEDEDGDGCAPNDDFGRDFNNDQEYLFGIGIDRQGGNVFFQRDNFTLNMQTSLPFNDVFGSQNLGLSVQAEGLNNKATVLINDLSTERLSDTNLAALASRPAYGNLHEYTNDSSRERVVENGRLRLASSSDNISGFSRTELALTGASDYLAADLALSSETTVDVNEAGAQAGVWLQGNFYNDLSNFGFNQSEGDHVGTVGIVADSSGSVFGEACLTRSQSAEFQQSCAVLDGATAHCIRFDGPLSFDTTHQASIELDRDARKMIFTLDGQSLEHELATNVFLPNYGGKSVGTVVQGAGAVVGFVDNLSTERGLSIDQIDDPW